MVNAEISRDIFNRAGSQTENVVKLPKIDKALAAPSKDTLKRQYLNSIVGKKKSLPMHNTIIPKK